MFPLTDDKLKISELQKEVRELKEENENLNWMLKKQFDWHSERIKKEIENEKKSKNGNVRCRVNVCKYIYVSRYPARFRVKGIFWQKSIRNTPFIGTL